MCVKKEITFMLRCLRVRVCAFLGGAGSHRVYIESNYYHSNNNNKKEKGN